MEMQQVLVSPMICRHAVKERKGKSTFAKKKNRLLIDKRKGLFQLSLSLPTYLPVYIILLRAHTRVDRAGEFARVWSRSCKNRGKKRPFDFIYFFLNPFLSLSLFVVVSDSTLAYY